MIIWSSINCPTVIRLPTVFYFTREKPLVKPTAPGSLLYHICLCDLFLFAFIFKYIKPKIQKYFGALFIWDLFIPSIIFLSRPFANFWRRYSKGIDNPFNLSGCEYLLFVCRYHLHSVACFSYWFDNLGLITKGNTYCYLLSTALVFPLRGKGDAAK